MHNVRYIDDLLLPHLFLGAIIRAVSVICHFCNMDTSIKYLHASNKHNFLHLNNFASICSCSFNDGFDEKYFYTFPYICIYAITSDEEVLKWCVAVFFDLNHPNGSSLGKQINLLSNMELLVCIGKGENFPYITLRWIRDKLYFIVSSPIFFQLAELFKNPMGSPIRNCSFQNTNLAFWLQPNGMTKVKLFIKWDGIKGEEGGWVVWT